MSEAEVKALEWQELRPTDDNGFAQDAYSPIGHYIATEDGWFLVGQTQWTDTYNLEHAKAGAQADFDARIRSAIERKAEPEECEKCVGTGTVEDAGRPIGMGGFMKCPDCNGQGHE